MYLHDQKQYQHDVKVRDAVDYLLALQQVKKYKAYALQALLTVLAKRQPALTVDQLSQVYTTAVKCLKK